MKATVAARAAAERRTRNCRDEADYPDENDSHQCGVGMSCVLNEPNGGHIGQEKEPGPCSKLANFA